MPPAVNTYDTTLGDAARALASAWHTSDVMGLGTAGPRSASASNIEGWGTEQASSGTTCHAHGVCKPATLLPCDDILNSCLRQQVVLFLDNLLDYRAMQAMHPKTTRRMAEVYGFDHSQNAEIRSSWYRLCLSAGEQYPMPG